MDGIVLMALLLLVLKQASGDESPCFDGSACQPDTPYCTSVGCVSDCPEGSFINGSFCVLHCDTGFVWKKECVPSCPPASTLTLEKVNGGAFHRVQFCVESCVTQGLQFLQYQDSCVSKCPEDASFVTMNVCGHACQDGMKYIDNACVTECPSKAPLTEYKTNFVTKLPYLSCVSVCPANTFVLNSTCTGTCPKYYYTNTCVDECPNSAFRFDRTCVTKCPFSLRYIWNNTCQSMCPQYYISNKTCVDNCPEYSKYSYGKQCFEKCPSVLNSLNNICVYHCPNSTHNGSCVSRCPSDARFVDQGKCVEVCSKGYYVGDGDRCVTTCGLRDNVSCVNECPTTRPNNKNGVCIKSCGSDMLIQNGTCIHSHDCYDKIAFEGHCLELCPVGSLYTGANSCMARTDLIRGCVVVVLFILIYCLGCAKFFKVQLPKCWRKRPRTLSIPMEDETALLPS